MNQDSSQEDLLREIERLRAEMYRVSANQDTEEAVASVQQLSKTMDDLINRFMQRVRDRDEDERQFHVS